ncbi:MAG: PRC-barrel domain-containing protein, partial [Pseudolabrys sp.]
KPGMESTQAVPGSTSPMPAQSTAPMPAQSTAAATQPGEKFVQTQHATDWRGSKLIGATVYGSDNSSIGEVNDVLISNDGQVRAAVIGVGGFLGVGEKNVAVPLDALQITRKSNSDAIDKIKVNYTKDELKNAPKFAYYEPAKATTTGSSTTDRLKSMNPMPSDKK